MVNNLGGWPEEGYLDIGRRGWWNSQALAFSPREVHLGMPFEGFKDSRPVSDPEWLASDADVDLSRIVEPPRKSLFGAARPYRLAFCFQLPDADKVCHARRERAKRGTHPVDAHLSDDTVYRQLKVYEKVARHFHQIGLRVLVRESFDGPPLAIAEESALPVYQVTNQSGALRIWPWAR